MVFTVGREKSKADVVIDDPTVSGKHCKITILDDSIIVEDLDSTNHTFVNSVAINVTKMFQSDQLKLGNHIVEYPWLVAEAKKISNLNKIDFRKEFDELKKLYETHKTELNNIDHKYQKSDIILKSLFSVPFVLVSIAMFKFEGGGYGMLVTTLSGLIIPIIFLNRKSNVKAQQQKEDRTVEFLLKYRCPKCGLEFGNKNWKLIEADKNCPKCKAQFV